MKYLHKTETKQTYREYQKFNYAAQGSFVLIYHWVYSIGCVAIGLLMLFSGSYPQAIFCFVMSTVLPVSTKIRGVREFNSNRAYKDQELIYEFYADYFQLKRKGFESDNGRTSSWIYDDIFKIIETETNFYMMVSKGSGLIIVKKNCTQELLEFLQRLK